MRWRMAVAALLVIRLLVRALSAAAQQASSGEPQVSNVTQQGRTTEAARLLMRLLMRVRSREGLW